MGDAGTATYYDDVMGLSEGKFYRLRLTFQRIQEPLTAFPQGTTINGYDVIKRSVTPDDICRYLSEHDAREEPYQNHVTETLNVLDDIGAIESCSNAAYSLQEYGEEDEAGVERAIQYRRLVGDEAEPASPQEMAPMIEKYREQNKRRLRVDDVLEL